MRGKLSTLIVLLVLLLAFSNSVFAIEGFGISSSPSIHEDYGDCNIWATAIYMGASKANTSWGADQVPDIVYDENLVIRIEYTSDSTNWKVSRVGLRGNKRINVPLNGSIRRGDIISATISIEHFTIGMNGLCPIIGQKGSNKAMVSFIIDVGKKSIYNEDFGLLRFNLIEPPFPVEYFEPIPELNLSDKEVYLLAFNGGQPSIGAVANNLIRQMIERIFAQREMLSHQAQLHNWQKNQTFSGDRIDDIAPSNNLSIGSGYQIRGISEAADEIKEQPNISSELRIALTDMPLLRSSKHYQIKLPKGINKIRYSLTRDENSIKWREVTLTSDHLRLDIPDGNWHFKVQAISDSGEFGPITYETFTENTEGGR